MKARFPVFRAKPPQPLSLMAELTLTREHHRDIEFVSGLNHFLVAHRAPRLDDRRNTGFSGLLDSVAKWEERIGAQHRALGVVTSDARLVHREKSGVDSRHLTSADADRGAIPRQNDGVRFYAANRAPRELKVLQLSLCRRALRHDPPRFPSIARGTFLGEKTASHPLVVERVFPPLRSAFEHAKIFLAAEYLESTGSEFRGDYALDEQARDRLGSFVIHGYRKRDHGAEGGHGIAGESLLISVERICTGGQAARSRMLDNGASDLPLEWIASQ